VVISAIDLEVGHHALAGIATEMGQVLQRSAHSPNIKERIDCSAAVFVPDGSMLAQAEHIPVHLGAMPASVAAVIERFDPSPDLQYAVNDPFAGGTHLNDLTLVKPVFLGSGLVGWVANRAHHADVGGEAPGSMPAHATTVDQEGIIVAPMPAAQDGRWLDAFLGPFLEATRTPEERMGDLSAQIGANEVGANRMVEYASAHGRSSFERLGGELLAYGERRMRAAIGALPDGEFRFADALEWGERDVTIRVAVRIDGAELVADFAGTDPQIAANFNAVEAVTQSCLYFAVRVATDPSIPANGGSYRVVGLQSPPGSVVNAAPPAAVAAGNVETSQRIADVLLGALAQAAPDRVPAASQGTMNNLLVGNERFAYYETVGGGQGGRPGRAGMSGVHTGMTNTRNTPIESISHHYPMRVTRTTIRRGSGGDGRFRGGDGIDREIEFLEPAVVSILAERRRHRPWGLFGGGPGATGEDWLFRRSGGAPERIPGKVTFAVEPGDRVRMLTPGGGGWGSEP
jgi:N-methylhydantoinase B